MIRIESAPQDDGPRRFNPDLLNNENKLQAQSRIPATELSEAEPSIEYVPDAPESVAAEAAPEAVVEAPVEAPAAVSTEAAVDQGDGNNYDVVNGNRVVTPASDGGQAQGIENDQNGDGEIPPVNRLENAMDAGQNGRVENQEAAQAAQAEEEAPLPEPDALHRTIEELKSLEVNEIENPNERIDAVPYLISIGLALEQMDARIKLLEADMHQRVTFINRIREALSMGGNESRAEQLHNAEELVELRARRAEMQERREEAEAVQNMQSTMNDMHKMPKEEVAHIREHGTMIGGSPVVTDGKEVNPDLAKTIAAAVESGAYFITRVILKASIAVVKGVLKGAFSVLKEAFADRG